MHARNPGHGGHGAVHGDEGSVHEERARIRISIFNHGTVHVQRPARPPGANPASEGQGRRAHGAGGQQDGPGGGARRGQGTGRQPRAPLQLCFHGDLRESQNTRERCVL